MTIDKKILTIYMNCHGTAILNYLNKSTKYKELYDSKSVHINDYILDSGCHINCTEFVDSDKKSFNSADVFICQYIQTDRGYLNHTEIIKKYIKSTCKIILIPHYVFYGYSYNLIVENKIKEITDIKDIKIYHQKITDIINMDEINSVDFGKHLKYSFNKLQALDNLSDIKMYDYVIENYLNIRLWHHKSYPTSIFFFHITNKILLSLNIEQNIDYEDCRFARNTTTPILPKVAKILNINFDCINMHHISDVTFDIYEYYCILKYLNVSVLSKCTKNDVDNAVNEIRYLLNNNTSN